jgi:hypothetical protein
MPVPCVSVRERANYPFSGQSFNHERIFVHVNVIIKIDEVVAQSLAEYCPGNRYQTAADDKIREG